CSGLIGRWVTGQRRMLAIAPRVIAGLAAATPPDGFTGGQSHDLGSAAGDAHGTHETFSRVL
ncbi:MAG: hypothetical protein KDC10_16590, partial [Calditrichaeota bacterium]|nr:hypothetical protein [Calditrichota bacterium]